MKHYYETSLYLFIRKFFFRYIGIPYVYRKTAKYQILNSMDSIQYILDNHCSVSRYGDGEFSVIWGGGNGFQQPNQRLAQLLKKVIEADDAPNHMIGIPVYIRDFSSLRNPYAFWPVYVARNYYRLKTLISPQNKYLNTQMTRFYYEMQDRSHSEEQLSLLKKIWDNRDIVIVEGIQTRSGIGNDLYDNAKSVQRILGPATNAIDMYDEMLEAITKNVSKDKLVLLSYGMVATVLAYDLAKLGYWAVDIGHLDLEYEWFKRKAEERVQVKGKYANEVQGGNDVAECTDPIYLSQILVDITK